MAPAPTPRPADARDERQEAAPGDSRGLRLTRRAIVLLVLVAVLVLSYASTLRVYLNQRKEIAQHEASIAQHQQQIESLQTDIQRWNDNSFVETQVRSRLGWVMPGEVGYKVIGPDGTVIGATSDTGVTPSAVPGEHATTWWERLEKSVKAADAEPSAASATSTPDEQKVITEQNTSPSASSTGR